MLGAILRGPKIHSRAGHNRILGFATHERPQEVIVKMHSPFSRNARNGHFLEGGRELGSEIKFRTKMSLPKSLLKKGHRPLLKTTKIALSPRRKSIFAKMAKMAPMTLFSTFDCGAGENAVSMFLKAFRDTI